MLIFEPRAEGRLNEIEILYHDDYLVVANKPCGMPSQPDQSGDESVLSVGTRVLGDILYPIHRLDRPASGIVILAVTRSAAAQLSEMLANRTITRRYWAIVAGVPHPSSNALVNSIRLDRARNKAVLSDRGRTARLSYRTLSVGERFSLLEVELETGRTHQIRVQLSAIGHPIRGDLKYGARRSQPGGGIALHAVEVSLRHPATGELMSWLASPPQTSLWKALAPLPNPPPDQPSDDD